MSMQRSDFARFFAAVNDGRAPFRWQERLLDTVLDDGRWPERIVAPTAAGKTSAIDVHAFAVALTADRGPRLPRRLVMVVDRRVLVDDQYQRARRLAADLDDPADDLVAEVASLLARLRWPARDGELAAEPDVGSPLVTARIRGGAVPSRSWRDHPGACAVLCATPDMWGSRLLFGGYGTPALAAAREAGLLAFDSAVVIDEAHLVRQLLVTARQVARLVAVAERPISGVPALQVVEVTATPADGGEGTSVTVDERDLADAPLANRLTRPKPVTMLPVVGWSMLGQAKKTAAAAIDAVMAMLARTPVNEGTAQTVGCFVNTVPMAVAVAGQLRERSAHGRRQRVVMVCGQARPADLATLSDRYPGILTPGGSAEVDVIVATQSLEVGVDVDLAGVVTELAAGSALAQRAGRVNRRGLRDEGPVTVLVPDGPLTTRSQSGPYTSHELNQALAWVSRREKDPDGMAPWAIRHDPPPAAAARRILYQRPELADAWHWARTSDDLAAEPELDLWLTDSLEQDASVGIVVRDAMPAAPAEAVEFVRDIPPAPWEVFPIPYRTAQRVLAELLLAWHADDRPTAVGGMPEEARQLGGVRVRGEEVTPLAIRGRADSTPTADIRPGDIVVIDSSAKIFTPQAEEGFSPQVVVAASAADADSPGLRGRDTADDVLHRPPQFREGSLILRLEARPSHQPVAGISYAAATAALDRLDGLDERGERDRRLLLASALKHLICDKHGVLDPVVVALADQVIDLLRKRVGASDVIVRQDDERTRMVVVVDRRRATAGEDLRQVFSPASEPVNLACHQHAVARRARLLADHAGLAADLADALAVAGEHHDDGKQDPRFQTFRLGAPDGGPPLAKSLPGATALQVRKQQDQAGLPAGWRHEQRSVPDCWDAVHASQAADPLLTLRLVGTSHGRGRSGFPHSSPQLAHPDDAGPWLNRAAMLFDEGGWDELIEITQDRYGVWGCAYLEALLRAADCQVSEEGR
jgi:CRISPR-associated endonuclease/helicase Cas3